MDWDPKINKDPVEKKAWLASSKNTFGFKDEAKQTVSSSLQNTLSNYFLKWSRQMIKFILSKQETSNKAKSKRENKSRVPGIERFIPGNGAKNVVVLIHTWVIVEETFNPLGVSLGASLESRCCHLILNSSV
jgi:hypothetical protein